MDGIGDIGNGEKIGVKTELADSGQFFAQAVLNQAPFVAARIGKPLGDSGPGALFEHQCRVAADAEHLGLWHLGLLPAQIGFGIKLAAFGKLFGGGEQPVGCCGA